MTRQTWMSLLAVVGIAFAGVGCGKSPFAPSDTLEAATLGPSVTVVPTSSTVAPGRGEEGRVHLSAVTSDPITITVVQAPLIHTTVNLGETAIITGLPPGSYTLVFTQNGNTIGTQQVIGVQPGEQVQITVVFEGGAFVMVVVVVGNPPTPPPTPSPCTVDGKSVGKTLTVEGVVVSGDRDAFREERNGTHGQDLFDVNASSASYRCVGLAKGDCKASLRSGAQVHVTGTLLGCLAGLPQISASEVKVQKP